MEKLLHWSISHAQGDKNAIEKAGQPDPKLLQQLFGSGPDEPTLMKQSVEIINDPTVSSGNKLIAFENLEMLIENLDNANNLENLKLWEPLINLLDHSEEEFRAFTLSIIGTAVQNNQQSQKNFSKYELGLSKIIQLAGNSNELNNVRAKAFYALSSLIRHNEFVCQKFINENGLNIVPPVFQDSNSSDKLKLRAMTLLSAVLTSIEVNEEFISLLRKDDMIKTTLGFLSHESDIYLVDRVLNFLSQLVDHGMSFNEDELVKLRAGYQHIEILKEQLNEDDYSVVKQIL